MKQYFRNIVNRNYEKDYFAPRTMDTAIQWLENFYRYGKGTKFFLYIDTFDPHEPWDPPRWYIDIYDPNYQEKRLSILDMDL